jgi:hypothetical protein
MNVNAQTIELYAKQLRTPAFNHYGDIIRQLGPDQGYEDFLIALMKNFIFMTIIKPPHCKNSIYTSSEYLLLHSKSKHSLHHPQILYHDF